MPGRPEGFDTGEYDTGSGEYPAVRSGASRSPVEMSPGMRWGEADRYLIERRLGRGSMATVYAATDTVLNRVVALKVFDEVTPDQHPSRYARLLHEARLVALIEHERIVRVYDVGTHSFAFVAMEYVPGGTLRQWMTGRMVSWPQAIEIATQIAEGLAELHRLGIIHHNLTPENVMLTAHGRIKLLDVGFTRRAVVALDERAGASTRPDAAAETTFDIVGTLGYMAPEQYGTQPLDARVDVFALGVIMYEIAAGQRLFRGETPREIMTATQNGAPPLTGAVWASVPVRFGDHIRRMLAVDPRQRFADGSEVLAAFRKLGSARPARDVSPRRPIRIPVAKIFRPTDANIIFALFLLATVAILWLATQAAFIAPLLISTVMVVFDERIAAGVAEDSSGEDSDGYDT